LSSEDRSAHDSEVLDNDHGIEELKEVENAHQPQQNNQNALPA